MTKRATPSPEIANGFRSLLTLCQCRRKVVLPVVIPGFQIQSRRSGCGLLSGPVHAESVMPGGLLRHVSFKGPVTTDRPSFPRCRPSRGNGVRNDLRVLRRRDGSGNLLPTRRSALHPAPKARSITAWAAGLGLEPQSFARANGPFHFGLRFVAADRAGRRPFKTPDGRDLGLRPRLVCSGPLALRSQFADAACARLRHAEATSGRPYFA